MRKLVPGVLRVEAGGVTKCSRIEGVNPHYYAEKSVQTGKVGNVFAACWNGSESTQGPASRLGGTL